jgi:hypothetical protein
MPIPASGSIGLDDIATEFGGVAPHGMSEYWAADPYKPTPIVGPSSLGDFYAASARTAQVTPGYSSDYTTRHGWSSYRGSYYSSAEEGHDFAAFGDITKTMGLMEDGNQLCCFVLSMGGYFEGLKFAVGMRGNNSDAFEICRVKALGGGTYDGTVWDMRTAYATWAALPKTSPAAYGWVWSNTNANAVSMNGMWAHLSSDRPVAIMFNQTDDRNR